jgi:hypothetical protein
MFVCGKGHPLLLVINEYTKDLNIMVKITEEKTIYLHHEMWAVWINISGKSENISCFKTQAFFFSGCHSRGPSYKNPHGERFL